MKFPIEWFIIFPILSIFENFIQYVTKVDALWIVLELISWTWGWWKLVRGSSKVISNQNKLSRTLIWTIRLFMVFETPCLRAINPDWKCGEDGTLYFGTTEFSTPETPLNGLGDQNFLFSYVDLAAVIPNASKSVYWKSEIWMGKWLHFILKPKGYILFGNGYIIFRIGYILFRIGYIIFRIGYIF